MANSVTHVEIRVNSTFGDAYASIGEVEFRDSLGVLLSNVGTTASASSTHFAYVVGWMLDADTTTPWISDGSALPQYAYFDFATAQDVASVRIINCVSPFMGSNVQDVLVTATHTNGLTTSSPLLVRTSNLDGAYTDHAIHPADEIKVTTEDAVASFSAWTAPVSQLATTTDDAVASVGAWTTSVATITATTDDAVAEFVGFAPLVISETTSSSDTPSTSIVASTGRVSITDSANDTPSISAFGTSLITLISTAQAIALVTFIEKVTLIATETAVDTVSSQAIGRYTVSDSTKDTASVVGTAFITATVTQIEHALDTVTPWWTAELVDSSTSTDTATGQAFGYASVTDQATSIDTWLKTLVVTVEAIDQAGEESSIDPHVIGLATILEQVRDLASVNSANRSQFTYTLNTLLNAGTRYGNYGFNSFAATDTACYGANDQGLFLLQGASDDGLSIDAVLKTNLSDLAIDGVIEGSKQKTVSDAYVGYTSSGNLILRVTTSNGGAVSSNDYALVKHGESSPDVSRVLFGRGVRARYWQFTIENTNGEAFEFDKIEFLPVVLTRRI